MEETITPAAEKKTSPWSKLLIILVVIIALAAVAIGAYIAGARKSSSLITTPISPTPQTEVLGTQSSPTPEPTEIPSLADTITPTLAPTNTPTPIPVSPTLKLFVPPKELRIVPSATPTPTIKFQQYQPPLQINP